MNDRYVVCKITKFIIRTMSIYIVEIFKTLRYAKYENMLEYAKEEEQTQYTKTAKHMHYVIT